LIGLSKKIVSCAIIGLVIGQWFLSVFIRSLKDPAQPEAMVYPSTQQPGDNGEGIGKWCEVK
jgi:hypothetical protein